MRSVYSGWKVKERERKRDQKNRWVGERETETEKKRGE